MTKTSKEEVIVRGVKGMLKKIKIKGKKNVYIIILGDINQLLSLKQ